MHLTMTMHLSQMYIMIKGIPFCEQQRTALSHADYGLGILYLLQK